MSEIKHRIERYRLQREATKKLGDLVVTGEPTAPNTIPYLVKEAIPSKPGGKNTVALPGPARLPDNVTVNWGPHGARNVTELGRLARAKSDTGVDKPIVRNPAERAAMADILADRVRRDAKQTADALLEDGIHQPQEFDESDDLYWPVPFVVARYAPDDAPGSHDDEPLVHEKAMRGVNETIIPPEKRGGLPTFKQGKTPTEYIRPERAREDTLKHGGPLLRTDGELYLYNIDSVTGKGSVSATAMTADDIAYSKLNADGSNLGPTIEQWRDMFMTVVTAPEPYFKNWPS